MTDEDLVTQHTWLEREQYVTTTRGAIDELWTEVEKKYMWYALGAGVGKYTTMGTAGDEWELAHEDGTPKNTSKDELVLMLNEQASDVRWTATEGTGDRVAIERDIGTRANDIGLRQHNNLRTARVPIRATLTENLLQGSPNDIGFRRGQQGSRSSS
jgi:hypothetical protein